MAFEDTMRSLREFDLGDLDFENVGSWPAAIKVHYLCRIAGRSSGGWLLLPHRGTAAAIGKSGSAEVKLRQEFEKKAFQAANLDAYRQQMVEMEESFGALVSQLPSETEVPGLLEDITNKGLLNGLNIASIDLKAESAKEFYVELPIAISASGSYHDLGAFISGMAGLPRIVTLHDFNISLKGSNANDLKMSIIAKTYRYKDGEA